MYVHVDSTPSFIQPTHSHTHTLYNKPLHPDPPSHHSTLPHIPKIIKQPRLTVELMEAARLSKGDTTEIRLAAAISKAKVNYK
jgi:hypothetical protein